MFAPQIADLVNLTQVALGEVTSQHHGAVDQSRELIVGGRNAVGTFGEADATAPEFDETLPYLALVEVEHGAVHERIAGSFGGNALAIRSSFVHRGGSGAAFVFTCTRKPAPKRFPEPH